MGATALLLTGCGQDDEVEPVPAVTTTFAETPGSTEAEQTTSPAATGDAAP
ncbi:hypothetical protein O2W15_04100 [Modestobacter sp. VKM Ac-2979]|uniref:hypothetical protein n=1 Tax=unclassified Modestobacter TaxID=2643866 RepID=UPI0022ABA838|nr:MULTISPECIES: hypothetical protein [unclassified Modestobacter]MCZ2810608.1 hypothetical protein [Modestobacter sp. VKM Ac-2979]MCZ2842094.1 hypothetical protein [Modestobacter sp. VKM Ac-2980]